MSSDDKLFGYYIRKVKFFAVSLSKSGLHPVVFGLLLLRLYRFLVDDAGIYSLLLLEISELNRRSRTIFVSLSIVFPL